MGKLSRGEQISARLNFIHEKMINELHKKLLNKEAKQIQEILKKIKKESSTLAEIQKSENPIEGTIANFLFTTIQKDPSMKRLFRNENTIPSSVNLADDIFEYELGLLFQSLEEQFSGQHFELSAYLTGNVQSSVDVSKITKKMHDNTIQAMKKAAEKTNQDLEKAGKKTRSINSIGIPVERSIKTDINGVSLNIDVSNNQINRDLQELTKLIAGKTFSLKNYAARNENFSNTSIGLGTTNLYKALMGSLNTLYSPKTSRKIIYQGMQILAGEQKNPDPQTVYDNIAIHFSHLRYMYDLSGAGLLQQNGKMTDFIIYNDPNSDNIAVRDTYSIILQNMVKNKRNLLFSGENEIAASRIFANPVIKKE